MNNNRQPQAQPPAGIALGDIYYVIFRHKWKILILSLTGILAAVALFFLKPPPYLSQAELLIQYVPQAGEMPLLGSDQKVIMPDSRGDDIINSEIRIMTSLDLAAAGREQSGRDRHSGQSRRGQQRHRRRQPYSEQFAGGSRPARAAV